MPRVQLTATELFDVARGLRLLAQQAREDAERQGQSSMRRVFEESAKRHLALAADFEAAWRAEQNK